MRTQIGAAGEYLLNVLAKEKALPYSHFYNNEPRNRVSLADSVWAFLEAIPENDRGQIDEWNKNDFLEGAHGYIEWAGWQLEDIGLVKITPLDTKLIDGEPDFLIELTEDGELYGADKELFGYRELNSRVNALAASEWLIEFLEHCDHSRPTLDEAMLSGGTHGVLVDDDCGNCYWFGTATFAWAFLVSLWHHVNEGVIRPAPQNEKERAVWDDFFAKHRHFFGRPTLSDPQPLWQIPLRLTPKALNDANIIRHVGWLGGE